MTVMNRIHNSTNPFQNAQEHKKVLCVCSAGLLRSPTLAHVLSGRGYNTRAAGITEEYALVPVDEVLVQWADKIVCVEPTVFHNLERKYPGAVYKTVILDIPDRFAYMDPQLRRHIGDLLPRLEEAIDGEFQGFLPNSP